VTQIRTDAAGWFSVVFKASSEVGQAASAKLMQIKARSPFRAVLKTESGILTTSD
jgi:hypothetical protein